MTKKKAKKPQKAAQSTATPAEPVKKEDDLDMLEDIKRDEDLFISESDVTNISNFIRTTNKSFNSLGNTVIEKFNGRCSLAILHSLVALFDVDSTDRDDVIRRLNIIYIVWRLPEMESELRLKPQKNMNDVYSHPFSTFLFWAEQLEHVVEATLARIIVTNNVGVVEKMTAPDFMSKAEKLNLYKVDRKAWEKNELENTDHWPEITEEWVSLSKFMKEWGCERKDFESGMAEAFTPLQHNPPTMLPPRMMPLDQEDPVLIDYKDARNKQFPHRPAAVLYSLTSGPSLQKDLKQAFIDLADDIEEYQSEVYSAMTPAEQADAKKVITYEKGKWVDSSDSEVYSESDLEENQNGDEEEPTSPQSNVEVNEEIVSGCVDRILVGHGLTTSKTDMMCSFVRTALLTHPQYARLLDATRTDEPVILFIKTNPKFAACFLTRNAMSEEDGCELFRRYLRIAEGVSLLVNSLQVVLKMAQTFFEQNKMTDTHKEHLLGFVRNTVKNCDETSSPSHRNIRLVAMLIRKLILDNVITAEEVATDVKPFILRHSENRECTSLYKMITGQQLTPAQCEDGQVTTTTTTTTSVAPNATSTTTTTTVVKQCGPAVIKQTSRKVVVQATSLKSSFQALSNLRKAQSMAAAKTPVKTQTRTYTTVSGGASTSSASATPAKSEDVKEEEETVEEKASDDVQEAEEKKEEQE